MPSISRTTFALVSLLVFLSLPALQAPACCPAPPRGQPVVNADQTVIIIWDAAAKTQHFIRQASFKSEADDFGFLVPTPSQPELAEAGNEGFPHLQKLTEPEKKRVWRPKGGVGCAFMSLEPLSRDAVSAHPSVRVLEEKLVAGFNAVVLEADSADVLVKWLQEHGYAYSPEVQAWAKPYVDAGWKITALKVAKDEMTKEDKTVAASALRLTFKTDRPLFPYREPDPKSAAEALNAKRRLLRIYFLADAKYQGELTRETAWTGQAVWAGKIKAKDRKTTLELLNLPENTGPEEWWLTEFEDYWPYQAAPADLYFSPDANQKPIKRPPIIQYVSAPWPTDITAFAIAAVVILPSVVSRVRRRRCFVKP